MEQMDSGTNVILGIRKELAEFQRANSADDDSGGGGDGGNGRALRAALRTACLAALRRQLENPAPDAGTGVGSAGVVDGEASGDYPAGADDSAGRRRRRLALSRLERHLTASLGLIRAPGAPDASADEEIILDMIRELEWGSLMEDILQRVHQQQRQRRQRQQQRREIARANTAANLLPRS